MLVAIIWLGITASKLTGIFTTDLPTLLAIAPKLPVDIQNYLFWAFAISFAIKVPLFPLHTWLPDAHVEAPTVGSVILAGVLLKMGTYGLLRFAIPFFPLGFIQLSPWIGILATVGIVYGSFVAFAQEDIKKVVA